MPKTNPQFLGQIIDGKLEIQDKETLKIWLDSFKNGDLISISVKKVSNRRTPSQNNAIHLYCELVAETLNEAGLTIEKVIKTFTMEHQWTKNTVKELLWREAQKFVTQKESTTELDKLEEIDKIWEIMNRFLARLKVESIPFLSLETQFEK